MIAKKSEIGIDIGYNVKKTVEGKLYVVVRMNGIGCSCDVSNQPLVPHGIPVMVLDVINR